MGGNEEPRLIQTYCVSLAALAGRLSLKWNLIYRNYKNFDNDNFCQDLKKELLGLDITDAPLSKFNGAVLSVLDKQVKKKKKKKYLRSNNCNFMTKELRKAILNSSKLRNKFLKPRNKKSKRRFIRQRNFCVQKAQPQTCNFIEKETPTQVFSCEFYEISKKTLFYIIPPVAASVATTDLLKINNGNTRSITQICSKLRIKSPERRH